MDNVYKNDEIDTIKEFNRFIHENDLTEFVRFCNDWIIKNDYNYSIAMKFFEKNSIDAFIQASPMTSELKSCYKCKTLWGNEKLEREYFGYFYIGKEYIRHNIGNIDKENNLRLLEESGCLIATKNKPIRTGLIIYDPITFSDFLYYVNHVNENSTNYKIKLITLMDFHLRWKRNEIDSDLTQDELETLRKFFIDFEN